MIKKLIYRGGILLIIFGLIWWFYYELTWEGYRDIGILSHPSNNEYSIKITQYSEFDWDQPLYFVILKKKKEFKNYYGTFGITNNTREKINSFEIHYYDKILYLTWKNGNIPLIMYDTQTEYLYPYQYEKDSYSVDKYKKELFEIIKKGNSKLVIE